MKWYTLGRQIFALVKFCEIDKEDLFLQTTLFFQIAYKLASAWNRLLGVTERKGFFVY